MKIFFSHTVEGCRSRMAAFVVGTVLSSVVAPVAWAQSTAPWVVLYQDRFDYAAGQLDTTFNTWFWREDSTGTHTFDVTQGDGCTAREPCVRLTAKASLGNTAYTNAEMYNNACVQSVPGGGASQQLATLTQSAWGLPLEQQIKKYCAQPYPYRPSRDQSAPSGVASSWASRAQPAYLEANPLALTAYDQEAPWEAVRDIAFNNPYQATPGQAVRITMQIRAETRDQGGSRGWGFWNTSMDPSMMQLAWFMEYSTPVNPEPKGQAGTGTPLHREKYRTVLMQTIAPLANGGVVYCSTPLPKAISIYAWHTYRIEWSASSVTYYVDGQQVAQHAVSLTRHMAFHNWVDNRNYGYPFNGGPANYPLSADKSNDIRSFVVATQAQGHRHSQGSGAATVADAACHTISSSDIEAAGNPLAYIASRGFEAAAHRQHATRH